MKTKRILLSLAIVAIIVPVLAANYPMKTWNWKQNRISFQTPKAMKIKKNSGSHFSGSWSAMGFAIMPSKDKNLNASQVAFLGYQKNTATKNKTITRQRKVNLGSGLKGYVIFGKGVQKGKVVKFVYLGLIDPNSPHNYAVNWVWWSSPRNDNTYDNMSYKMAKSFRKI